jgi:hypothetical protein
MAILIEKTFNIMKKFLKSKYFNIKIDFEDIFSFFLEKTFEKVKIAVFNFFDRLSITKK